MAFYEKHWDRLLATVPFRKSNLDLDIHKSDDWKKRLLFWHYDDWKNNLNLVEEFATQWEAKKYWIAYAAWFDAWLACD